MSAGVAPELVAKVALAVEEARSEGAKANLAAITAQSVNRERQQRWRDRQKEKRNVTSVTDNVTITLRNVTPRARVIEYKPLESKNNSTLPTNTEEHLELERPTVPKAKRNVTPRGGRLPEDWTPDEEILPFACDLGFSENQIWKFHGEFCDYWRAVPGARGCKLDWDATFRNWLRKKSDDQGRKNGYNHAFVRG